MPDAGGVDPCLQFQRHQTGPVIWTFANFGQELSKGIGSKDLKRHGIGIQLPVGSDDRPPNPVAVDVQVCS
jgi:hypothetical protein